MVNDKESLDRAEDVLAKVSYKEVLDKITEENRKAEQLVNELSKLKAEQALAGKSLKAEPQSKRKRTEVEFAKAFLKGEVKLNEEEREI